MRPSQWVQITSLENLVNCVPNQPCVYFNRRNFDVQNGRDEIIPNCNLNLSQQQRHNFNLNFKPPQTTNHSVNLQEPIIQIPNFNSSFNHNFIPEQSGNFHQRLNFQQNIHSKPSSNPHQEKRHILRTIINFNRNRPQVQNLHHRFNSRSQGTGRSGQSSRQPRHYSESNLQPKPWIRNKASNQDESYSNGIFKQKRSTSTVDGSGTTSVSGETQKEATGPFRSPFVHVVVELSGCDAYSKPPP